MIFQNWNGGESRVILNKLTIQVVTGRCCWLQGINPSRAESQPFCGLARSRAGKCRLRQPRALSAAPQQQHTAGANLQLQCYTHPLFLWQCRNTFPGAPSQRHSEYTEEIPAWILAISRGVFKLWYYRPEGKKMESQIIIFMSNRSILAFVISRLTKPMQMYQRKLSLPPLIESILPVTGRPFHSLWMWLVSLLLLADHFSVAARMIFSICALKSLSGHWPMKEQISSSSWWVQSHMCYYSEKPPRHCPQVCYAVIHWFRRLMDQAKQLQTEISLFRILAC